MNYVTEDDGIFIAILFLCPVDVLLICRFFDWIASPSGANICSQVPLIKKAVEKKNAKGKVEDLFYRWPRGHCHASLSTHKLP